MAAGRFGWIAVTALLGSLGCGNGGGTAGAGGSTSSSTTTSATTSGTGGSTTTTACPMGTGGSGPTVEPSGFTCSGAAPHLTAAVVPITTPNCSTSQACHVAMKSGGGVSNMLVGVIAEECLDGRLMIKPCDPEHSYVIHKLTGHNLSQCSPATTMPLGGAPLSHAEIQTIYDWICAGQPTTDQLVVMVRLVMQKS